MTRGASKYWDALRNQATRRKRLTLDVWTQTCGKFLRLRGKSQMTFPPYCMYYCKNLLTDIKSPATGLLRCGGPITAVTYSGPACTETTLSPPQRVPAPSVCTHRPFVIGSPRIACVPFIFVQSICILFVSFHTINISGCLVFAKRNNRSGLIRSSTNYFWYFLIEETMT